MSAYNYIQFAHLCPNCCQEATIRAQTHVASDYGGDEVARFCHQTYELGTKMRWWASSHRNFAQWKNGNRVESVGATTDENYECCYAHCSNCEDELFAVIRFVNCTPVQVLQVGLEKDWPPGYSG